MHKSWSSSSSSSSVPSTAWKKNLNLVYSVNWMNRRGTWFIFRTASQGGPRCIKQLRVCTFMHERAHLRAALATPASSANTEERRHTRETLLRRLRRPRNFHFLDHTEIIKRLSTIVTCAVSSKILSILNRRNYYFPFIIILLKIAELLFFKKKKTRFFSKRCKPEFYFLEYLYYRYK